MLGVRLTVLKSLWNSRESLSGHDNQLSIAQSITIDDFCSMKILWDGQYGQSYQCIPFESEI